MTRARKLIITFAGLVLFTSVAAGIAYLYLVYGGRAAVNRALAATVEGRPIPSDILFNDQGFSLHMRDPGKLPALLKNGYAIEASGYPWWMWPSPASVHAIRTTPHINFICEVIRRERWELYCGQIRCTPDDPCIFRSAAGEFRITHGE